MRLAALNSAKAISQDYRRFYRSKRPADSRKVLQRHRQTSMACGERLLVILIELVLKNDAPNTLSKQFAYTGSRLRQSVPDNPDSSDN